jgi:SSS family transporter
MSTIDLIIVVAYIAGCTILGARLGARAKGLAGYFLGESDVPAWAVMVSIVATETSTATFLSVPGLSYKAGGDCTYLQLAFGYILGRIVVATVLLPAYFKGTVFTAYQLLDRRFGGATRTAASLLFLVARTLGDGLRLFLAAKALATLTGWPIGRAIVVMVVSTVVYTYLGGMRAVIWTDVLQFGLYLGGAAIALAVLAGKLPGGWGELWATAEASGKLRVIDPRWDPTRPYTIWAGLIGGLALSMATHGADQSMVQRYLSARSRGQAAGALVVSGFVVLAQFALFLFIGVALSVFFADFPTSSRPPRHDEEFAAFIARDLPRGVTGLVVAAIFASAMGSLSSALNASAATTVNDLYRPLMPKADERHLLRVSKVMTAFWGLAKMAVAFAAIGLKDNVVENALRVASFVLGPLLGLFLLGLASRRVGQRSALLGLVVGIVAVSLTCFRTPIAWPWWSLIGSTTVLVVGLLAHGIGVLARKEFP